MMGRCSLFALPTARICRRCSALNDWPARRSARWAWTRLRTMNRWRSKPWRNSKSPVAPGWLRTTGNLSDTSSPRSLDRSAHIEQVSVDPRFAGRRIGRQLICSVKTWARERNLLSMTLTTYERRKSAYQGNVGVAAHLHRKMSIPFAELAQHDRTLGGGRRRPARQLHCHGWNCHLHQRRVTDAGPQR